MKAKEPVRLRIRKMSSGNSSLYLDTYLKGKREYEYLNLYLIPEKTKADKEKNRQTLQLAEAIKSQRVVDFQNGRFGFDKSKRERVNFMDYFFELSQKKGYGWYSAYLCVKDYRKNATFADLDKAWANGIIEHLKGLNISQNSKYVYLSKIKACINHAIKNEVTSKNPFDLIDGLKKEDIERNYLTLEELQKLARTTISKPLQSLRNAFLFSCLTGLRKSDILLLRWKDVQENGDYTRIIFRQKKTKNQEYLDISKNAVRYMGERGNDNDLVFNNFSYSSYTSFCLNEWAKKAGINKYISFHSARHTFAVMMLELNADIYTVSKLLGHRDLRTTQIYAKIVDKKKQQAVSLIPDID